ncbi:mucin-2 [Calliphora vicina]|uniref:mucin-2 n=1 Tax=Calliphora vicina TaxID=7373 RepID=UPI00325AFC31
MLRQNSSCINWHFLLVGLFFIIMQCDARAVNVSNTWTMPQEGLNVFYRFFRDRISWFEADAVCQFHHANLVTVDNSFQFDATRDLLRELDVNDIVWIGLMRPQSSDRFMWSSNSRALVADTGYWAESLPLMDAPLCAVIDPIRDYRWHALRCGGPETASFLCEMPVPSWADACNLKDMPNLTLQYMADTASIELIRNCQEEGLLRTMCRGKQDRERALQDLICPRERLEAQRINDITNSHFKSLQIINSIPSDNNENNDIELLPMEVNYGPHYPEELQTEKNTVQRLIEQFNVDELMQADEPSNMETVSSFYKIPGLIPKPVKKSAKKVLEYPKKDNGKPKALTNMEQSQKDKKRLPVEMDEMMMGDQPLQGEPEMPEQLLNEDVSNEIMEPLPHIKKTNIHKEDGLEKMEKEAIAMKKSLQKSKEMENKKMFMMSPTTTTTTTTTEPATTTTTTTTTSSPTTTEKLLTTTETVSTTKADELTTVSEDHTHKHHHHEGHTEFDNSGGHLTTTTSSTSIGHPMHPQQPRSNVLNEESQHAHTKESTDSSHFIPPMLMVKSHYVPPVNKHGHTEHEHHHQHHQHAEEQPHLETTTEEQAQPTIAKYEQNQTSDIVVAVTTPKVLDLEKTTLKTLDTSGSSTESEKQIATTRQEEHQTAPITTTTESDSSIKPITEQQTAETEQRKNSKNLNFEEIQTTMTTTTIQAVVVSTTAAATTNSEEINKNNAGPEKDEDEQTTHTDAETTQATILIATTEKSLKSTEKLYDLETAVDNIQKIQDIADTTTAAVTEAAETTKKTEQHVITTEEKLAAIKSTEHKEHLQTIATTTQKLATTETAQVITTSTIPAEIQKQKPTTTTTITETQSLQQMEKVPANGNKEEDEDKQKDQDEKETIVKTTEILVTSSPTTKAQATEDTPATTTTVVTTPTSSSITTTTTVKPITTTAPQNEVKSTETSFSSTSTSNTNIITTTTTDMPTTTNKDLSSTSTSTTTITPPTTTTFSTLVASSSSSAATTTTIENDAESATARAETF